jgi:hypothetical protein
MRRIVTVWLVALLLAGCGPKREASGTVSGTITYQGKPVNGAALLLYGPTSHSADFTIPVDQEGKFSSTDVPPGDYKVVVQPSAGSSGPSTRGMTPAQMAEMKGRLDEMKTPPTIKVPSKYLDPKTSDLQMKVTGGKQEVTLELKG